MNQWQKTVVRYRVGAVLLVLLLVELLSLAVLSFDTEKAGRLQDQALVTRETPLRISEITGPMIDAGAAMVVVEATKPPLPVELWLFLLVAYGALLIFNFSFTFTKAVKPQWFWEGLYTLLALWTWALLDSEGTHLWFPFTVVKVGLILFVLYLYLWEKKRPILEQE